MPGPWRTPRRRPGGAGAAPAVPVPVPPAAMARWAAAPGSSAIVSRQSSPCARMIALNESRNIRHVVPSDLTQGSEMPVTTHSPLTQRLLFALNFFRHPFMLGSIWPSSRYLVDEVLRPVDWQRALVIVEYGPGVGTITGEILRRMRPDAHLVAIETNEAFVKFLKSSFADSRLHVANESATDVGSI